MALVGTIWRWKSRMVLRHFAYDVRHTVNGKLAVVLGAFGLYALPQLLMNRPAVGEGLAGAEAMGTLAVAHLILLGAFVLAVTAALAMALVVERGSEPLEAVPYARPAMAAYQILVPAVGFPAAYLLGFFYVFHGRLLASALGYSAAGLVGHALGTTALLFACGILVAGVLRRTLTRPGLLRRGQVVRQVCGVLFLVSFVALPILPSFLAKRWPEALGAVEGVGGGGLAIPPLALARAISEGQVGAALVLAAASVSAGALAVLALVRWLPRASMELPTDLQPALSRRGTVFVGLGRGAPGVRRVVLFWGKDVAAPLLRQPSRYFAQQWGLAFFGVLAVWGGAYGLAQGRLPAAGAEALVVAACLAVPAMLAGAQCLGSLGTEGQQLALLRPVLSGGELFLSKALAQWLYVTVHALAWTLLLIAAAGWAGVPRPGLAAGLATALAGGVVFTLGGMAMGFLFPDFRGDPIAGHAGVGSMGKMIYYGVSAYLVGMGAAGAYVEASGLVPPSAVAGSAGILILVTTAVSSALAAWGVRRVSFYEP